MTPLEILLIQISDPFRIVLVAAAVLLLIWLHLKQAGARVVILLLVLLDIGLAFLIPTTMAPHGPTTFWPRVIWGLLSNTLLILIIGMICGIVLRHLRRSE